MPVYPAARRTVTPVEKNDLELDSEKSFCLSGQFDNYNIIWHESEMTLHYHKNHVAKLCRITIGQTTA